MSKIDDCVAGVVRSCTDDEAVALTNARAVIDQFYYELDAFLKDWPHQVGSREVSDLIDKLTAASEHAVRQNALSLSNRLERCIDYARAKAKERRLG
jgi:hypothetical protein